MTSRGKVAAEKQNESAGNPAIPSPASRPIGDGCLFANEANDSAGLESAAPGLGLALNGAARSLEPWMIWPVVAERPGAVKQGGVPASGGGTTQEAEWC